MVAPNLIFQDDLKHIANFIFIPQLQENMHRQVGVDNKPFPALEPETIARKSGAILKRAFTKKGKIRESASKTIEKAGLGLFSNKTLFETGKLVSSFISRARGKSTVIVTLNAGRKDVGTALQIDGVGNKKKKFNFFGVSRDMQEDATKYMKKRIQEELKRRGTR